MNRRTVPALALATALTLATASAAEAVPTRGLLISPNPNAGMVISPNPTAQSHYDAKITINGEALESYDCQVWDEETSTEDIVTVYVDSLPAAPEGYVPLRAVTQGDGGNVIWFEEENYSWFKLWDYTIETHFDDMTVTVDGEKLEGVAPLLVRGVTYLPVSVIGDLAGFTVEQETANGGITYRIDTPNGTPMMKLANQLLEVAGLGMGMRNSPEQMERYYGENHGFKADMVTEAVMFSGMITTPDALSVGRIAEGREEALRAFFEAYRQEQEDTFSWYLSQNLPKVENAKFVTEGDWFLFVIGENADEAVEAFRTAVAAMEK